MPQTGFALELAKAVPAAGELEPHLHEPAGVLHIPRPLLEAICADVVQHQVIQAPLDSRKRNHSRTSLPISQGAQKCQEGSTTPSGGWEVLYHEDIKYAHVGAALTPQEQN